MKIEKNLSYLLSTSFMQIVPFLFLLFITRILDKEVYGTYVLALSFSAIICSFFSLSIQLVFEKEFFAVKDGEKSFSLLFGFSSIFIFSNLVGFALTIIFADEAYKLVFDEFLPKNVLGLAYLANVIVNLKALMFLYIRNIQKHGSYLLFTIVDVFICYLLMTVAVFVFENIESLLLAQITANLLILFCVLLKYRSPIENLDLKQRLRQVLQSLPLLPRNIVSVLQGRLDSILIGRYVGVGDTAIYAIGNKLGGACFNYMSSLENAYIPQVLELMNNGKDNNIRIREIFNPYLFISLFLCLLLGVFASEAISLLFSSEYAQAIHLVKVLAFYYSLLFWGKTRQLLYAGKYTTISMVTSIRAILGIVISLYAIKLYGFWGAVWGMIIAQFLVQPFFIFYSQKEYFIPWQWARIAALYALLLAGLLGSFYIEEVQSNFVQIIIIKLFICLVFLLIGKGLGFIKTLNPKKITSNFS